MGGMRKTGDWKKLGRIFAQAGAKFKQNVSAATSKNGRLIKGAIVERIETQQFSTPLTPEYLKRKLAAGLSEQVLIATGTLLTAIRFQKRSWKRGFVSVNRTEPRKGYNLGVIHEKGTRDGRVPARPYVEPGFEGVKEDVVKNYEAAVEDTFK